MTLCVYGSTMLGISHLYFRAFIRIRLIRRAKRKLLKETELEASNER